MRIQNMVRTILFCQKQVGLLGVPCTENHLLDLNFQSFSLRGLSNKIWRYLIIGLLYGCPLEVFFQFYLAAVLYLS
jgi:hypothetical protein